MRLCQQYADTATSGSEAIAMTGQSTDHTSDQKVYDTDNDGPSEKKETPTAYDIDMSDISSSDSETEQNNYDVIPDME